MAAVFVTTLDNPYDYWTHFDEWYAFDTEKGYDTLNYVARIALTSTEMGTKAYERAVEEAVDEICRLNITGNYKKIYEDKKESDEDDDEYEEGFEDEDYEGEN